MAERVAFLGLGVMGSNLARNVASRGIAVACYDFDVARREDFAAAFAAPFTHAESVPDLLNALNHVLDHAGLETVDLQTVAGMIGHGAKARRILTRQNRQ